MMTAQTLVWAKLKYCAWWPGFVSATIPQIKKKKGQVKFIFFFGSRDFAWVEEHNIRPYVQFRQEFKKPKMSRLFNEAIDRIEEYISDPVKYKVNAEQEFVPKTTAKKAPRKLNTIKKKTNKKVTPVTLHRYPTRYKAKTRNTNQFDRPASPLPERPKETPLFMETITQSISKFNQSLKFGIVGLGTIGGKMAENLMNSGHEVLVFNMVYALSEIFDEVDIICLCIPDPLVLKGMFFKNGGFRKSLTMLNGKGFVQMMSLDATLSQKIAKGLIENGGRYLEAHVHGSKNSVEPRSLIVLAAGDRTLFDECQVCLQGIGKNVFFFGEVGSSAKMHAVLQLIMGITTAGLAEGMALANRFSLNKELLDIMQATDLLSPLLSEKFNAIINLDFEVHDPLRDTEKDLRLAIALGDNLDQPTPLTATASKMYLRAVRSNSKADSSSVYMQLMH